MILYYLVVLGAQASGPGSGVGHSVGAGSPFNNYVAGVAAISIIVGAMITLLLTVAFLIVNLGLMSKRPEDRIGGRTPSDLGILKPVVWPQSAYEKNALPAEENDVAAEAHEVPSQDKEAA